MSPGAPALSCPALVLSGGGVRGAYEVGIVAGIVELLGLKPADRAPFRVFAGTSVGAINAAYLAANTHRGDLGVAGLQRAWSGLRLHEHLDIDPLGLIGYPRRRFRLWRQAPAAGAADPRFGRSLLDPRPLERLVNEAVDWAQLRDNVRAGSTAALVVAALNIGSGRTTLFTELAEGVQFRPSRNPRRQAVCAPITAGHVLASAALPMLFPARRIGNAYYCDGGLRFNTPIAPAIRIGAERLVVVSLRHSGQDATVAEDHTADYPSMAFLLGKLLNALLLDPVHYDLQIVARFNRLLEVLEETLTEDELARVQHVLTESRGAPYRRLQTLMFAPTRDIGVIAADYVRRHLTRTRLGPLTRLLLRSAAHSKVGRDADLASYVLFDGAFADELIELGRHDALARADEVRAFFATGDQPPAPCRAD